MTIYCDNQSCAYNEDGFCWCDKLVIEDLTCQSANGEDDID